MLMLAGGGECRVAGVRTQCYQASACPRPTGCVDSSCKSQSSRLSVIECVGAGVVAVFAAAAVVVAGCIFRYFSSVQAVGAQCLTQ